MDPVDISSAIKAIRSELKSAMELGTALKHKRTQAAEARRAKKAAIGVLSKARAAAQKLHQQLQALRGSAKAAPAESTQDEDAVDKTAEQDDLPRSPEVRKARRELVKEVRAANAAFAAAKQAKIARVAELQVTQARVREVAPLVKAQRAGLKAKREDLAALIAQRQAQVAAAGGNQGGEGAWEMVSADGAAAPADAAAPPKRGPFYGLVGEERAAAVGAAKAARIAQTARQLQKPKQPNGINKRRAGGGGGGRGNKGAGKNAAQNMGAEVLSAVLQEEGVNGSRDGLEGNVGDAFVAEGQQEWQALRGDTQNEAQRQVRVAQRVAEREGRLACGEELQRTAAERQVIREERQAWRAACPGPSMQGGVVRGSRGNRDLAITSALQAKALLQVAISPVASVSQACSE